MSIETIKQALEALETAWYHVGTFAPTDDAIELYDQARTSLRQAIAGAEKQQRTWVGRTEEDLKLLSAEWRIVYGAWMDDFAKDIEAKLKEKNHV
jgi:hypothetical protein